MITVDEELDDVFTVSEPELAVMEAKVGVVLGISDPTRKEEGGRAVWIVHSAFSRLGCLAQTLGAGRTATWNCGT